MKSALSFIVPLVFSLIGLANATEQNPPAEAKSFNGKKYLVYEDRCSWKTARERCKQLGGQLVVIHDKETQEFITTLANGRSVWLGATDEVKEGRWVWVDGTEMDFRHFHKGEPNNANNKEHMAVMTKGGGGRWSDVRELNETNYVCEWPDAGNSTTPSAGPSSKAHDNDKQTGNGQTLDPIGTWRYSDTVQLEIRPDGTILSNSKPAGKWTQRDNKAEYFIVLNDRSEHIGTVDKYKRILRTESRARGVGKSMERIDNGPTRNPDAPDQPTAWKMECRDLETDIKSMEVKLAAATAEAADLWQKHHAARAAGRISTWNIEAQKAESQARGLERSIKGSRKHLLELRSKLGVK